MKLSNLILLLIFTVSCSTTYKNQKITNKFFPSISGESLAGKKYKLPEDLKGKPALLMIGYKQKSQFDIDRWLLGLLQLKAKVTVYEVPTVEGMIPGLISGKINSGMRSGIPKEDWAIVITVYKDAEKITRFTGTENPLNSRIVLLDSNSKVVWFHDRGYSASKLLELNSKIKTMP